jgi:hypothetical protein
MQNIPAKGVRASPCYLQAEYTVTGLSRGLLEVKRRMGKECGYSRFGSRGDPLSAVIRLEGPDPSYTLNVSAQSQDPPWHLVFGPVPSGLARGITCSPQEL